MSWIGYGGYINVKKSWQNCPKLHAFGGKIWVEYFALWKRHFATLIVQLILSDGCATRQTFLSEILKFSQIGSWMVMKLRSKMSGFAAISWSRPGRHKGRVWFTYLFNPTCPICSVRKGSSLQVEILSVCTYTVHHHFICWKIKSLWIPIKSQKIHVGSKMNFICGGYTDGVFWTKYRYLGPSGDLLG